MEDPTPPPQASWWAAHHGKAVLLAILGVVGIGIASTAYIGTASDHTEVEYRDLRPIQMPVAVEAQSSGLPDDAPVIGVSAGGRHRAYALNALLHIDLHVANDMLGGVPITVSYCDRTDCTGVYTDPTKKHPLDIAVGGFAGQPGSKSKGTMLLRIGSDYFLQDTTRPLSGWGKFPYAPYAFQRVTWGEWRRTHPDTDVVPGPPLSRKQLDRPTS